MKSIWKDVPGYEGLYQCDEIGRVKSLARVVIRTDGHSKPIKETILAPQRHNHGYAQVTLCKDGDKRIWLVHRLIAMTFIPNPDNLPCINHKNQDKTDNRAENLEWCTVAYNNAYGDRVQRCAEKHRGLRHSEEAKRRMSESRKNPSDETRRRLSQAAKGRKHTAESLRKMSEYARSRKRGPDGRWCL